MENNTINLEVASKSLTCKRIRVETGKTAMVLAQPIGTSQAFLIWEDSNRRATSYHAKIDGEAHWFVCFCYGNACRLEQQCSSRTAPTEYADGKLTNEYRDFQRQVRNELSKKLKSVCVENGLKKVVSRYCAKDPILGIACMDIEDWVQAEYQGREYAERFGGDGI